MTTVIYHSADYDGIFCREIARKFLPDAELIGWNFGDPLIPFPKDGIVYVLDLSPDCLEAQVPNPPNTDNKSRMVWIDHHKTSIEKWASDIPGYRIDGVAACRLAWQWFKLHSGVTNMPRLPEKQAFINRTVVEPLAVCLAGEYDVAGPHANEEALDFQFGLRSTEIAGDEEQLLNIGEFGDVLVSEISERGQIVRAYLDRADLISSKAAFTVEFEGLRFLCTNGSRANSKAFSAMAESTNHDAVMSFFYNGKLWTVSLYHAKHRTDLDLSAIAKKYGGGGHKGACGFTCKTLPFAL